jgi:hypothetical protein
MPRLRHLGSASDTPSRAGLRARPSSPTGYSPGLPGHVPLVDFCNCLDPQAQPRPLQTPSLAAVVTTARWVTPPPGGRAASWAVTVQGSRRRSHALVSPTSTSCADADLPQTDRPRHLLSLADAACVLDNVRRQLPAGYRSLRRLLSKPLEDPLARPTSKPRRAF